jgi:PhoPQ-activated pathogenicity-related protein
LLLVGAGAAGAQPLMDYVNAPDSTFRWSVDEVTEQLGTKLVKIDMVSQTWQGVEWDHQLWILMPDDLEDADLATLVITGGEPDMTYLMLGSQLVNESNCIFAVLGGIPKQPLYGGLKEDALIAYTFVKLLETGDATWPLLFPMTKSAVRAMDAVQGYLAEQEGHHLQGFITTGASKRGWTTWLSGVVDERVIGIAPIVYDNLNLPAQMKQQMDVYGAYSEQIDDYTEFDLQDRLQSAEGAELGRIVDPYTYRHRITEPKLILVGSNDPYWTLESAKLYFDHLAGPAAILYFPNGGHDLGGIEPALNRLKPSLLAFIEHVAGRTPWPELDWSISPTAGRVGLTMKTDIEPERWGVWVATSNVEDFRGAEWHYFGFDEDGEPVSPGGDAPQLRFRGTEATYGADAVRTITVEESPAPYMAVFGEMRWEIDGNPLILTTVADIVKRP